MSCRRRVNLLEESLQRSERKELLICEGLWGGGGGGGGNWIKYATLATLPLFLDSVA